VSRISVVAFGCLMGILAVLLNVAGVSLGWVRRVQLSVQCLDLRNVWSDVVPVAGVLIITHLLP
jgi:hypothetical protein